MPLFIFIEVRSLDFNSTDQLIVYIDIYTLVGHFEPWQMSKPTQANTGTSKIKSLTESGLRSKGFTIQHYILMYKTTVKQVKKYYPVYYQHFLSKYNSAVIDFTQLVVVNLSAIRHERHESIIPGVSEGVLPIGKLELFNQGTWLECNEKYSCSHPIDLLNQF